MTNKIDVATSGTIGALLPVPIIDRIDKLAALEGIGRSAFIRRMVLRFIADLDESEAAKVSA